MNDPNQDYQSSLSRPDTPAQDALADRSTELAHPSEPNGVTGIVLYEFTVLEKMWLEATELFNKYNTLCQALPKKIEREGEWVQKRNNLHIQASEVVAKTNFKFQEVRHCLQRTISAGGPQKASENIHGNDHDLAVSIEAQLPDSLGLTTPSSVTHVLTNDTVQECLKNEHVQFDQDQTALLKHVNQFNKWEDFYNRLKLRILTDLAAIKRHVTSIPAPPDGIEHFQRRYDSLQVLGRMIERCEASSNEPASPAIEVSFPDNSCPEPCTVSDIQSAKEFITRRSQIRYATITTARIAAEQARERVLRFLKGQVLPIYDALIDGRRLCEGLPPHAYRDELLKAYKEAYEAFDELNANAGLLLVPATVLEPFDYELHEPVEVVTRDDMPDECVVEVCRHGFMMSGIGSDGQDGTVTVIRPAQVVVSSKGAMQS